MGFKVFEFKLSTDFTAAELKRKIEKKLKTTEFSYSVAKQSLDARKKHRIFWLLRVGVSSPALPGPGHKKEHKFEIPYIKREKKVVVVGSGPAGFFCADTLVRAGFNVTLFEQGSRVPERSGHVTAFERSGEINERNNYAFGEGGAGTFSDGKLTSRTKSIAKERDFIIQSYIKAGAPGEIAYLAQPHIGSDNLVKIVKNLGEAYLLRGGSLHFNTRVTGICLRNGSVQAVETDNGRIEADHFVFAGGNSDYGTFRMLIKKGIPFRVKPFAIGCRVEHAQEIINLAQWGQKSLAGVKAAAYRLTWKETGQPAVYSFCMCPGGQVVPAAPFRGLNIVNGKSDYSRNRPLANSGIVAALDLEKMLGKKPEPLHALEWLEKLERKFFDFSNSYAAPACRIEDFLAGKVSASLPASTYPHGLVPADFKFLFPADTADSLCCGIKNFCKKLKGFEKGILLGLESKTSCPIQALREGGGRSPAASNLYICGEGSGWSGGIISSAADGIRAARAIMRME